MGCIIVITHVDERYEKMLHDAFDQPCRQVNESDDDYYERLDAYEDSLKQEKEKRRAIADQIRKEDREAVGVQDDSAIFYASFGGWSAGTGRPPYRFMIRDMAEFFELKKPEELRKDLDK